MHSCTCNSYGWNCPHHHSSVARPDQATGTTARSGSTATSPPTLWWIRPHLSSASLTYCILLISSILPVHASHQSGSSVLVIHSLSISFIISPALNATEAPRQVL